MATADAIAQQRQQLSERLARLDADRAKLQEELDELAIAERVLARLDKPRGGRRAAAKSTPAAKPAPVAAKRASRRRASTAAAPAAAKPASPGGSSGAVVLAALRAHPEGADSATLNRHIADKTGRELRPNHLGRALHSHRRGGRAVERDGRWFLVVVDDVEMAAARATAPGC